jgi:general secretion pathway protein H
VKVATPRRERGLTLIELTVAIGIVAILLSGVVMGVGAVLGTKAKAAAGELGGVIRALYDTASLSGKTCRLVFELPDEDAEEGESGEVKYRAECAQGAVTTDPDRDEVLRQASAEAGRRDDRDRGRDEDDGEDREVPTRSGDEEPTLQELMAREQERVEAAARFGPFENPQIQPRTLPSSVRLAVWTRHQREAQRSGVAYLYFFPQGFTEKAQLYVRQGDSVWTILVAPLTGKTTVVAEEVEVPR